MEKTTSKIVSENLTKLRKAKGITQVQLAQEFNFSDKTISKWESGESLPNIDTLHKLCDFYGITLNDLVDENYEVCDEAQRKKHNTVLATNKILISLLGVTLVWIIATITYIYMDLYAGTNFWMAFVWAVPISFLIGIIFNSIWGSRTIGFIFISAFVWTLITAFYLQLLPFNLWTVFILGVPSQIAIILWSGLKRTKK